MTLVIRDFSTALISFEMTFGTDKVSINDKNIGWDGVYKGVPQELEVYTYVVKARFLDDSSQTLKGNITLLR